MSSSVRKEFDVFKAEFNLKWTAFLDDCKNKKTTTEEGVENYFKDVFEGATNASARFNAQFGDDEEDEEEEEEEEEEVDE
jgi:hypothetical protein